MVLAQSRGVDALREARRQYRRVMSAWAVDALRLRVHGTDEPGSPAHERRRTRAFQRLLRAVNQVEQTGDHGEAA